MSNNIFDYITDVLFKKQQKFSNYSNEQLDFQPYMLQRWCSMSSRDTALILNETTNRWLLSLTDKKMFYQLLHSTLPRQKQKRVAYIKKPAKSDKEDTDIKDYSNVAELSQREIKSLMLQLKTLHHG